MLIRLIRRFFSALVVLVLASLIAFSILNGTPGDVAQTIAGDQATAAELNALRTEMGLDQPLLTRFFAYMGGVVQGDLGSSLMSGRPVAQMIGERFANTLLLACAATFLAVACGLFLGMAAAFHHDSWMDLAVMSTAALSISIPSYGMAVLLTLLFSVNLRWLPVAGGGSLAHLVLPALVLALPMVAVVARISRSSLLDAARAEYVLAAHARGITRRVVWHKHILRNALVPVVTMVGLNFGHLLGGAFVVETIYGWPGLGRMIVQAVFEKDFPVIMGAVVMMAAIFQLFHLIIDMAHGLLDPRVGSEAL